MPGDDPSGLRPRAARAQDAFRRDDQVDAEVVLRLGQRAGNDLKRVDGGGDAGVGVDAAHRAAEGVLQIGVAAALAHAGAGAGHGDRSGDNEVDVRQRTGVYCAAGLGRSSDRRRGGRVAQTARVQLPEAARLPQPRDGHVHDLASRSARSRTYRCGASGLHLMTFADCPSSVAASRSAAADAPTKFGMRPRAPGNPAARRSSRSAQMRSGMACSRSCKGAILAPAWMFPPVASAGPPHDQCWYHTST